MPKNEYLKQREYLLWVQSHLRYEMRTYGPDSTAELSARRAKAHIQRELVSLRQRYYGGVR